MCLKDKLVKTKKKYKYITLNCYVFRYTTLKTTFLNLQDLKILKKNVKSKSTA